MKIPSPVLDHIASEVGWTIGCDTTRQKEVLTMIFDVLDECGFELTAPAPVTSAAMKNVAAMLGVVSSSLQKGAHTSAISTLADARHLTDRLVGWLDHLEHLGATVPIGYHEYFSQSSVLRRSGKDKGEGHDE